MDRRTPLSTGTLLNFPGMPCRIEEFRGKGSNALVYRASYEDPVTRGVPHDVLIKELFPLHLGNAIYRDAENRVQVQPDGADTYALHRLSFEQGNEMHLKLLRLHPDANGGNIITFPYNNTYYTLLPLNGGKELYDYAAENVTLRRIAHWMLGILEALDAFHQSGYLHLDIAPDNVILIPRKDHEDVMLIDYNSVCAMDQWQSGANVISSVKDGFTALELQTGEYSLVGRATDLYSVAAVFFYCLMGRRLMIEEVTAAQPPDVTESPVLKDAPDTVVSMARRILTKGLASIPKRRYQSADAMRKDFQELINRVDCVGVTAWAILEKERARMTEWIRQNPSLQYLKDERRLYPLRIQIENDACDLKAFTDRVCRDSAFPYLLHAEGGLGKTTALQLCAIRQNARYSAQEPVAVYISAANYRPNQNWFIYDSILEALRFHPDTGSFENARHELNLLLGKPLQTRSGSKPVLLILLDGLNEISCDAALLTKELAQIARMPGAAVILSSRTDIALSEARRASLLPLEEADVEDVLRGQGLLMPESGRVRQLLRTPLLLSMYVHSAVEGGKQLNIETTDALMECYLDAMERKGTQQLPDDAPERWQIDAAIHYVLPVVAAATRRGALKDADLLERVEKCRRVLRSRSLLRVFPQWIGRRRDIFSGTQSAEEWYGLIVQRLLWQKLALLVRDADGGYRLIHQNIAEWLIEKKYEPIHRRIVRRYAVRHSLAALLAAAILIGGGYGAKRLLTEPPRTPYDDQLVEDVMDISLTSYLDYGGLWKSVIAMLDDAEAGDLKQFDAQYAAYQKRITNQEVAIAIADSIVRTSEESDGEVVAYSNLPIDFDAFEQLTAFSTERRQAYDADLPALRFAAEQYVRNGGERAADFIKKFRTMVECDAGKAVFLLQRTYVIHQKYNDHITESERLLLAGDPMAELRQGENDNDVVNDGDADIALTKLTDAAKKAEAAVDNHYMMIQYDMEERNDEQ